MQILVMVACAYSLMIVIQTGDTAIDYNLVSKNACKD